METSQKWALGFVAAGILSLGLFTILSSKTSPGSGTGNQVAVAEVFAGEATILRASNSQKEKITNRKWIRAQESVETEVGAEVILDFPSNFRIKMNPQSLITLDTAGGTDLIIIKKGNVTIENEGREGSLFISKEGAKMSAMDYAANQDKKSTTPPAAVAARNAEPVRLSQKMIQDILNNLKPQFYKCYSQLLQKTPGVNGQASMAFMIQASGKVSHAEIASSTLSDAEFKKCLLSILERVEFPSFTGAAISTEFPIRFE